MGGAFSHHRSLPVNRKKYVITRGKQDSLENSVRSRSQSRRVSWSGSNGQQKPEYDNSNGELRSDSYSESDCSSDLDGHEDDWESGNESDKGSVSMRSSRSVSNNKYRNPKGNGPKPSKCSHRRQRLLKKTFHSKNKQNDMFEAILARDLRCGDKQSIQTPQSVDKDEAADVDADRPFDCGKSPLYVACREGKLEFVKCFSVDCDPNTSCDEGYTALFIASQMGHSQIVEYLVKECNANPDQAPINGATPLYIACENGHLQIVQYLCKECNANPSLQTNCGATPLFIASELGHLEIVKFLVKECCVDPNQLNTIIGATALYIASQNGHLEIVKFLIKECNANMNIATKDGTTPLCKAVDKQHVEVVDFLLREGADTYMGNHITGSTPMHLACLNKTTVFTKGKNLKKKSAAVEILEKFLAARIDMEVEDAGKCTPFLYACKGGCQHVLNRLLKSTKTINTKATSWNGNTGLHLASWRGHVATVKTLLSIYDCNTANIYGCTALHLAAMNKKLSVVKVLVQHGADLNLLDKKHCSAVHYSFGRNGDEKLARYVNSLPNIDRSVLNDSDLSAVDLLEANFRTVYVQTLEKQVKLGHRNSLRLIDIHTSAAKFEREASKVLPDISVSNVKLIRVSCFLQFGEFPHYSVCQARGWHLSGDSVAFHDQILFVSHRWGSKEHPDPDKYQYYVLVTYLKQCDFQFQYMWLDYACICQDKSDPLFQTHLRNISTALHLATKCIVIPKIEPISLRHDSNNTALVSNLKDYLGRAWCVFESVSCLLISTSLVCAFQVGEFLVFKDFDRAEGAASDLGFYSSRTKAWNEALRCSYLEDLMKADVIDKWDIKEPCRILALLNKTFSSSEEKVCTFLKQIETMSVTVKDKEILDSADINELWLLLGACDKETDNIVVLNLFLFIGLQTFKPNMK